MFKTHFTISLEYVFKIHFTVQNTYFTCLKFEIYSIISQLCILHYVFDSHTLETFVSIFLLSFNFIPSKIDRQKYNIHIKCMTFVCEGIYNIYILCIYILYTALFGFLSVCVKVNHTHPVCDPCTPC